MAKRMTQFEIDTLTGYITKTIYEEQVAARSPKVSNCTKKEYEARRAKLRKLSEEYDAAQKAFCDAKNELCNNPLYLNGKQISFDREFSDCKVSDNIMFGSWDYEDNLRRKVREKITISSIVSSVDLDTILDEMRALVAEK